MRNIQKNTVACDTMNIHMQRQTTGMPYLLTDKQCLQQITRKNATLPFTIRNIKKTTMMCSACKHTLADYCTRRQVNYKKTKEMLLGAVNGNELVQLIVDDNTITRVFTFKLLGIQVKSNLKWNSHVDYIHAKASSRLSFLKPLKKCSNNIGNMLHFYTRLLLFALY